jgi:hypothetical protein
MHIEHGEVTIEIIDNIILVRSVGAFNEYGAKKYTEGIKAAINGLSSKKFFSILTNNLKFLGATPEAYQVLEAYNLWLNTQNLIAKAMVITSSTTLDVINMFSPSRSLQQNENFDNEAEALAWLKSLNF